MFQTSDITEFYRSFEGDLKKSTINWRVYKLVHDGILERIGRGTFKIRKRNKFLPEIAKSLRSIHQRVKTNFPYAEICSWNTSVLNQFMVHQPARFFTLVETEKDVVQPVFHQLKESTLHVFLNPGKELLENYLSDQKDAIIVKPLISESPLLQTEKIVTATLEKILVDIYCDKELFTAFQGSELRRIFKEAFHRYTINEKALLRYADRRKRKNELKGYLDKHQLLAANTN